MGRRAAEQSSYLSLEEASETLTNIAGLDLKIDLGCEYSI